MNSHQLLHSTSMLTLGTKLLPGVLDSEGHREPIVGPSERATVINGLSNDLSAAATVTSFSPSCRPGGLALSGLLISLICHALALLLLAATWSRDFLPTTVPLNLETPPMIVSLGHIDLHSDTESNIGGGASISSLIASEDEVAPLVAAVPSGERVEPATKPQEKIAVPAVKKANKIKKLEPKPADPKWESSSEKPLLQDRPQDASVAPETATASIDAGSPDAHRATTGSGTGEDATALTGERGELAGSQGPGVGPTVANYQAVLGSWLTRFKFYPRRARTMGVEGVVAVHIVIERDGSVVSRKVVSSSGSSVLDDAAKEMVRLADPFPKAPSNISGDQIEFTVPVKFFLS